MMIKNYEWEKKCVDFFWREEELGWSERNVKVQNKEKEWIEWYKLK